jgi:hypothetical protein
MSCHSAESACCGPHGSKHTLPAELRGWVSQGGGLACRHPARRRCRPSRTGGTGGQGPMQRVWAPTYGVDVDGTAFGDTTGMTPTPSASHTPSCTLTFSIRPKKRLASDRVGMGGDIPTAAAGTPVQRTQEMVCVEQGPCRPAVWEVLLELHEKQSAVMKLYRSPHLGALRVFAVKACRSAPSVRL